MCKILLFGGTTEGRELSEFLVKNNISALVCVATTYGCKLASSSDAVRVLTERLTAAEMEALMQTEQPELVIDATASCAAAVTENILQAAQRTKCRISARIAGVCGQRSASRTAFAVGR